MITVHNFANGLLNPGLAYVVSCLGAFLGLRCIMQARAHSDRRRAAWLCTAAVAIGATGIWAMHFIAMLGFSIPGQTILYNVPLTLASMVLAIVVVGIGLFIVTYGNGGWTRLLTGGVVVGLGVASMHYIGMEAMVMKDTMSWNPLLFIVSIIIAIVAGTAALWIGTWVRGWFATLGASMVMGVAVSGMHYTGMAAMHVQAAPSSMAMGGVSGGDFLLPMIVGISLISLVLTLIISLSPSEEEIALDASIQRSMAELERRQQERGGPAANDFAQTQGARKPGGSRFR
ncbi:MAG TPA: MHYT domain-containing protein [Trebonia sp.]|nr:MHYT domain-containing protein [Trebonia sp.]